MGKLSNLDKVLLSIWALLTLLGIISSFSLPLDRAVVGLIAILSVVFVVLGGGYLGSMQRGALITLLSASIIPVTILLSKLLLNLSSLLTLPSMALFFSFLLAIFIFFYFSKDFVLKKESFLKIFKRKRHELYAFFGIWFFVGLFLHYSENFSTFGSIFLLSSLVTAYALLFLVPPALRAYKLVELSQLLTEDEEKLRTYIKKYGKNREVIPFYASWLGVDIETVNKLIDHIEAKGWLGHNFFSLDNPFYWLAVLVFSILGVVTAPQASSTVFLSSLLIALSVSLLGPQKLFSRTFRKIFALFVLFLAIYILKDFFLIKISLVLVLLALVAIYFAYADQEIFSAFFASMFLLGLYGINYLGGGGKSPNLVLPLILTLSFFLAIVEEAMREGPWEEKKSR